MLESYHQIMFRHKQAVDIALQAHPDDPVMRLMNTTCTNRNQNADTLWQLKADDLAADLALVRTALVRSIPLLTPTSMGPINGIWSLMEAANATGCQSFQGWERTTITSGCSHCQQECRATVWQACMLPTKDGPEVGNLQDWLTSYTTNSRTPNTTSCNKCLARCQAIIEEQAERKITRTQLDRLLKRMEFMQTEVTATTNPGKVLAFDFGGSDAKHFPKWICPPELHVVGDDNTTFNYHLCAVFTANNARTHFRGRSICTVLNSNNEPTQGVYCIDACKNGGKAKLLGDVNDRAALLAGNLSRINLVAALYESSDNQ